jgi:hypothetical protein
MTPFLNNGVVDSAGVLKHPGHLLEYRASKQASKMFPKNSRNERYALK